MRISLSQLIAAVSSIYGISGHQTEISLEMATPESREVRPGALFCAMRGARLDGHDFIPEAIAKGAAAILAEHRVDAQRGCPTLR